MIASPCLNWHEPFSERIQNSTRIGHVTSVADLEHLRADQLLDCSVDGVENRGQKVCHTFPILFTILCKKHLNMLSILEFETASKLVPNCLCSLCTVFVLMDTS